MKLEAPALGNSSIGVVGIGPDIATRTPLQLGITGSVSSIDPSQPRAYLNRESLSALPLVQPLPYLYTQYLSDDGEETCEFKDDTASASDSPCLLVTLSNTSRDNFE